MTSKKSLNGQLSEFTKMVASVEGSDERQYDGIKAKGA